MATKSYQRVYRIFSGFLRRVYRVEIRGAENEPAEGPVLVCANHTAFSDPIVLSACTHRQLRYFAKAELFRIPILGKLITALGAFPVKRGGGDVHAIKQTLRFLEQGEAVGVFPQGHRYPGVHPSRTEPKSGVGLMAYRAGCPVLPVGLYTKKYKMHIFRKTTVIIGKPITPEEMNFQGGTPEEYARVSRLIFDRITELVP